MLKYTARPFAVVAVLALSLSVRATEWTTLLDQNLSNFEVWIGIPHTTTQGLPAGTPTSEDCRKGTPLGLNADSKKVFLMTEEKGTPVLHISGEMYGGLVTLKDYESYHLSLELKWGEKKWAPRLEKLRDSGILYHSQGKHGAFWKVWKSSLEFQVQETDLGDFIPLAGPNASVRSSAVDGSKLKRFDPTSETYANGYTSAYPEMDKPHGEWNHLELYAVGDTAVHVVNGTIVMVVENARKKDGSPLTKGQIQIQSEAAECFYKNIKISKITDFPENIKSQLRLKDEKKGLKHDK